MTWTPDSHQSALAAAQKGSAPASDGEQEGAGE